MALLHEHKHVERLLLEKGARPYKEYNEHKLYMAIEEGNARDVESYLLSGVDINLDQSGPLRKAVRVGHKNIVVLLLSKGANPNPDLEHGPPDDSFDEVQESPLTIALDRIRTRTLGQPSLARDKNDIVQILLDAGAEPNEEDREKMEEWGCFEF